MSLTAIEVKTAKPADKPYKLAAGKGLYLLVNQIGKYWRMDYRFDGKRKNLALGVYPDVSLADANEKQDIARKNWPMASTQARTRRRKRLRNMA